MLSNKMTFSLILVFMLGLVFTATPALAQSYSIVWISPSNLDNIRWKVDISLPVTADDLTSGEVTTPVITATGGDILTLMGMTVTAGVGAASLFGTSDTAAPVVNADETMATYTVLIVPPVDSDPDNDPDETSITIMVTGYATAILLGFENRVEATSESPLTGPLQTQAEIDEGPEEPEEVIVGPGSIPFTLTATDIAPGNYIIIANKFAETQIDSPGVEDGYTVLDQPLGYDLEDFFKFEGGTIQLIGPPASPASSLVISEIMWGGNVLEVQGTTERLRSQWIELYAPADSGVIALEGGWRLVFTSGKLLTELEDEEATGILVDTMSNWGPGFWSVTDGDHGSSGNPAKQATGTLAAVPSTSFRSMYRAIGGDHTNEEKMAAERLAAISDGIYEGDWVESDRRGQYQNGDRFASPGEASLAAAVTTAQATLVPFNRIIFNEIAHRSEASEVWIELYNKSASDVNIKDWTLSFVTGKDEEPVELKDNELIIKTDDDDDIIVPAGEYLLLVNSDPSDTSLALGENVETGEQGAGVQTRYYVNEDLKIIPDSLMILRTETKKGSHEKIEDVAAIGNGFYSLNDTETYITEVWPLKSTKAGSTKADDLDNTLDKTNLDNTWIRHVDQKDPFHGDTWKPDGVYTGAGVDRNKARFNTGTPGYANPVTDEFVDKDGKAEFTGEVIISEIMVDQGGRDLPQWIELYNTSHTQAVTLENWRLRILNVDSLDLDGDDEVKLKFKGDPEELTIAPNQTFLIVSGSGKHTDDFIPSEAIYSLYPAHKGDFDVSSKKSSILSTEGFYISLTDPRGKLADKIGNIDSNPKTHDTPEWELPMDEEVRSSLIRKFDGGDPDDGTDVLGWVLASSTDLFSDTYYGHPDDVGAPGARMGSALPVELSSFRPVRNAQTGHVNITWITQSELNNAGFNVLRSDSKDGDFTVINVKGIIAGHGTTSEKHVYTFTDTTAKPNVVYYYQIEDVSLDGKRTTLRTTHLRGNVTAGGKLTTIWGDLKTLQ